MKDENKVLENSGVIMGNHEGNEKIALITEIINKDPFYLKVKLSDFSIDELKLILNRITKKDNI